MTSTDIEIIDGLVVNWQVHYSILNANVVEISGQFDNMGKMYIYSPNEPVTSIFVKATTFSNPGSISFDSIASDFSTRYALSALGSFINSGSLFMGVGPKPRSPLEILSGGSWINTGSIHLIQFFGEATEMHVGSKTGSITNYGVVCFERQIWTDENNINGAGCIHIGPESVLLVPVSKVLIAAAQTLYMASSTSSIHLDSMSRMNRRNRLNWRVVGFGNLNTIVSGLKIRSWDYVSGDLILRYGLFYEVHLSIGEGYDKKLFIVDDDTVISYSGSPVAGMPGRCYCPGPPQPVISRTSISTYTDTRTTETATSRQTGASVSPLTDTEVAGAAGERETDTFSSTKITESSNSAESSSTASSSSDQSPSSAMAASPISIVSSPPVTSHPELVQTRPIVFEALETVISHGSAVSALKQSTSFVKIPSLLNDAALASDERSASAQSVLGLASDNSVILVAGLSLADVSEFSQVFVSQETIPTSLAFSGLSRNSALVSENHSRNSETSSGPSAPEGVLSAVAPSSALSEFLEASETLQALNNSDAPLVSATSGAYASKSNPSSEPAVQSAFFKSSEPLHIDSSVFARASASLDFSALDVSPTMGEVLTMEDFSVAISFSSILVPKRSDNISSMASALLEVLNNSESPQSPAVSISSPRWSSSFELLAATTLESSQDPRISIEPEPSIPGASVVKSSIPPEATHFSRKEDDVASADDTDDSLHTIEVSTRLPLDSSHIKVPTLLVKEADSAFPQVSSSPLFSTAEMGSGSSRPVTDMSGWDGSPTQYGSYIYANSSGLLVSWRASESFISSVATASAEPTSSDLSISESLASTVVETGSTFAEPTSTSDWVASESYIPDISSFESILDLLESFDTTSDSETERTEIASSALLDPSQESTSDNFLDFSSDASSFETYVTTEPLHSVSEISGVSESQTFASSGVSASFEESDILGSEATLTDSTKVVSDSTHIAKTSETSDEDYLSIN